jgi:hypothetical protein
VAWTATDYLLADLIDTVAMLRYETSKLHGVKSAIAPERYPRPGTKRKEPRGMSVEEALAIFRPNKETPDA